MLLGVFGGVAFFTAAQYSPRRKQRLNFPIRSV